MRSIAHLKLQNGVSSLQHGFIPVLLSLSISAAVESLHSLNDQISHFIVNKSKTLDEDEDAFLPSEKESLKSAMMLMRHLLMDAQVGNQ